MEPFFLAPVLDTCVRALPWTFRDVVVDAGTRVALTIPGPAGGRWLLEQQGTGWQLFRRDDELVAAEVMLDSDTAWRLFTKGVRPSDVVEKIEVIGNLILGHHLLETVAVIA